MLVIKIKLATISLVFLAVALISACPAVLGLLLGVRHYRHLRHVQIPSCLTGSASILSTILHLFGLIWSYKIPLLACIGASSLLLVGSGLYYLSERIPLGLYKANEVQYRLEMAFLTVWIVTIICSVALTAYALGVVWLANNGVEESDIEFFGESRQSPSLLFEKPRRMTPSLRLDSPVIFPHGAPDMPQLSPRLSWPSALESIHGAPSFESMQSALMTDNRILASAPTHNLTSQGHGQPPASPNRSKNPLMIQPLSEPLLAEGTPSVPKSPRSPMKLHLTKSTFSLKRENSRASQKAKWQHPSSPLASSSVPALRSLPSQNLFNTQRQTAPVSKGSAFALPSGVLDDNETPRSWMIIPNENVVESRTVSGSSQMTGRIFPASEYNRKINAAGFQKDEPVPLKKETLRHTISQYDLEQAIRTRHSQAS